MLRLLIRKFPSIVSVLWTPPLPGHAPPPRGQKWENFGKSEKN